MIDEDGLYAPEEGKKIAVLKKLMESAPYEICDYEEDKFDCFDMTLILWNHLRNGGFETKIIFGWRTDSEGNRIGHGWLEYEGKYLIECTKKIVAPRSTYRSRYTEIKEFDSTDDLVKFCLGCWRENQHILSRLEESGFIKYDQR